MSDAPYSCYYELISASTVVGSEFFQCYNHFTQKFEDYLCLLSSSSLSIYKVQRSEDDADDLEFEESSVELRYHRRVFGHLQSVKRFHRGNEKSDVLFIAMDSGKLIMAEFAIYQDILIETIVCNLELGNDNPALNGKQYYLGHGSKPVLVVSEEYHSVALSVYGEQLFSCTVVEDVNGNLVVDKKLVIHLQSDLLLTGPVLDICYVGGYGNPTVAILQQDNLLSIGHAAKVLNTDSLSVLGFNYDTGVAALIWRIASLPHDCSKLISFVQNSLPGAIMVISQNAIIIAHQDSTTALPTNGFASVTVGTNTNISMKPWKGSEKGLVLSNSKWLQFGPSKSYEGNFMGLLRDGTLVLLHLSYYTPRQSNTLDMELVVFRDNFPADSCCISCHEPELLFVSSRNGHQALYRIGYNAFIRQAEQDQDKILYKQSFLDTTGAVNNSIVDLDEEEKLYGAHGLDVEKANSSQWIIDLRLLDVLTRSGPVFHGMIMKPDETFTQIDHVRWNRTANVQLANYSSAASYIPERESKDSVLLSCSRDKDASLNRFFSGIAYSKSATKSFPGGKTMYNFNAFGKSVILLVFANKTRIFQCERTHLNAANLSRPDTNVRFQEWSGEDSGFIVNSKSLYVGVISHTESEIVVVQVTPTVIRLLKIFPTFESEPIQDMSLHESIDVGGLGGLQEEVFISVDSSSHDGHIVLVSSHLNTYFAQYHKDEENMELRFVHRDPLSSENNDHAHYHSEELSIIDSAIVSVSLYVGKLNLLEFDWNDMIQAASTDKQYSELEQEEMAMYGEVLARDEVGATHAAASEKPPLPSLSISNPRLEFLSSFRQSSEVNVLNEQQQESYAIITEKNGILSIFRLADMTCIVRTNLVSLQTDHIPLQTWNSSLSEAGSTWGVKSTTNPPGPQRGVSNGSNPQRSTSNGSAKPQTASQNDESFIVETKMFLQRDESDSAAAISVPVLYLALVFSSGEFVLYRVEDICGVHIALNRLITQTIHTRRYPGVPFVRGINNSEANEIPSIFMTSPDAEYICRMPPSITVMQHTKGGTKVYIASHDTKQLCFDRKYPVLLSLDFPETPLVNFGVCSALPLFPEDASILGTLWYEYEDLDTTEMAKLLRIKNKPLKQSTFGIYRQIPRQSIRSGMNGTMQAVSIEKTVHKCMEIIRLSDNKTEQALLEKRTYLLLCSQDVFRPFNPHVVTEADGDTENVDYERYFPNVESFQQPNPDLAPLPLSKTREYRVCLMQNGKIIDNFQIGETEKVLDATVLYLSVEKPGQLPYNASSNNAPPKTFEKRVFVLVSTLYVDKRGEDTQGNGRMLLLGLDYAMFEDDDKVTVSKVGEDGTTTTEDGVKMEVDDPSSSTTNGNGHSATAKENDKANTSSSNKQSLAQQQFLGSIQAKLRQIWIGPGPASVVHQMPSFPSAVSANGPPGAWSNYVLATVGSILYVYKFNSDTMELNQVAFYFSAFYISALTVVKQYILLSDMTVGVQLLYFREEDYSLHLVSKDFDKRVIMKTDVMLDGRHIGFVAADDGGHIQIFQNNPKKHESLGGSRLLCLSDFNVGSPVSWMASHDILYPEQKRMGAGGVVLSSSVTATANTIANVNNTGQGGALMTVTNPVNRIPPGISVTSGFRAFTSGNTVSSGGYQKKVSNFPLQQFGVRMLKTTVPVERKTCTMIGTFDGGLACLIPMEEKMFKRLLLLEQIMNMLLPTTLALNPRDYRLLYPSNVGLNHNRFASPGLKTVVANGTAGAPTNTNNLHYHLRKTILDGCSLFRYLELEYAIQEEIAQMIGSHAILVRENLREIEHVVRFF